MPNLLQKARELAAEIVLRDKTGAGAESAARNFDKVGDAADKTAKVVDRTEKVNESAARSYERLQKRLDPLAAAQQRMERDEKALTRAREQGVITTDRYERNLRQLRDQFKRTEDRIKSNERAQRGLNRELSKLDGIGRSAVTRLSAIGGAVAGATAAFSTFGAVRIASGFEREFAKVETLLDQSSFAAGAANANIAGLKDGIRDLRAASGDSFANLSKGLFDLVSAGVAADDSIRVLNDANTLAKAGVTDVSVAVDGLTTAINAYGESSARSEVLASKFFTAQKFGKTTVEELAKGLGQVAPLAAQLGVSLDELFASQAAATSAGIRQSEAFTGLKATLTNIVKPAKDASDEALRLGVAFDAASLKSKGLTKFLSDIQASAKFSDESFQKLFGSAEALNFVLALTGGGAEVYAKTLRALGDEVGSVATLTEAYEKAVRVADQANKEFAGSLDQLAVIAGDAGALESYTTIVRSLTELLRSDAAKSFAESIGSGIKEATDAAYGLLAVLQDIKNVVDFSSRRETPVGAALGVAGFLERSTPFGFVREGIGSGFDFLADRGREQRGREATTPAAEQLTFDLEDISRTLETTFSTYKGEITDTAALLRSLDAPINNLADKSETASDNLEKLSDAAKRAAAKQFEDDIARADRAASDIARGQGGDLNAQRQVFADVFERALKQFQPAIDEQRLAAAVANASAAFSRDLSNELEQSNKHLDRIEENTGDTARDEKFLDRFSQIAEAIIRPLDQMAGGFDQLRGALTGKGSLLEKIAGAGQGVGNILSGAGDSLSKVFGDSLSGLSSLLGSLGPIAGGIGAAANLAASAISFFKDLFGKRSDFTAQAIFEGGTGRVLGTGQDKGADDNARARDEFIDAAGELTRRLLDLTGGASTARLNVAFRSDRKTGDPVIDLGYNNPATGEQTGGGRFTDVESAIETAVRLTAERIQGGDRGLVAAAQELLRIGTPADEVITRLESLSDVLKSTSDVVDPLAARIDKVVEAFAGLETTSGALGGAFAQVIDRLAADVDAETSRALTAELNPKLGAIEQLLREQAARRDEIARLEGLGGNVDGSLVAQFQRRQILNEFDIDARFREASDPAAYAIEELLRNQSQEREAFRRAIEQSDGLVGQSDYLGLIRAQEAERRAAFQGLSDEEKIRLAGRGDEFTDLEGQYALTVDRLLEETAKLVDGFEDERARLQDVVATRGNEINTLDQAIRRLGDTGSPRASVDRLRADLEDLGNRALNGDEETRRFARAELPAAVDAYVQRLEEVFASGGARDNGVAFARDLLTRVRDQASAEKTAAERQLETLERSRDLLEDIRDLMAAPQLDIAALVNAASQFDQDSPFAVLAFQLADLEARQTAQSERLVAVLEQIAAGDVGLGAAPESESFTGASPASAFDAGVSGGSTNTTVATQSSNSQSSSRDADVVQGLIDIAQAVDDQTGEIVSIENRRERRDARVEAYLKTIATTRTGTLG